MNESLNIDSFDPQERRAALLEMAADLPRKKSTPLFNMHCHSFFSYNSEGWSPSHIVYKFAAAALHSAALCDFDVLDGMREFLEAGRIIGLRTAVHLETRAYVPELSDVDISSPGEPGVTYIMGCGFTALPETGSPAGQTLAALRAGAQRRNLALIERINERLPAIAIDYERDVTPLTPRGVATERHIVRAYRKCAERNFTAEAQLAEFWAPLLKCTSAEFIVLRRDIPKLEDLIRNALAKRGGIGYIQPTSATFPPASDFVCWVRECGAIPTIAWLDGTSGGEADAEALLDLMCGMGCAALNIIPDRNWNYKNPDVAALKQKKLDEIVAGAVKRDMPINIGTEMNKGGLPFVDDISGTVLNRYRQEFTRGANIMVGQTVLAEFADLPYCGDKAVELFASAKERNDFFAAVGALPALTTEKADHYSEIGTAKTLDELKKNIGY